ncbi:MAG: TonB-dependent receptor [Pseudomonadota bacterium]
MKAPRKSIRRRPLARALILALATTPLATLAQETPPPGEEPAALEEVLVTGTRIEGVDLEGAVQALQIDREAILESGADSLGELMRDLTVTGGGAGTFSTSTAGPLSSDTPVGAAGVSLRGLGTSSTLTLINGRRATISSFARGQESFIDVNSIPLAAVERVEILPNGASAIYGADAVAGVVNYVLRDDYQGAEVSVSYANSTESTDEGRTNLNLVAGFGDDRQQGMIILDYFDRNALYDRDRSISQDSVRPSQQGFFPSFNDLVLQLFDQTEEPQDGGCPADQFGFGNFGEFCEVNTNRFVSTTDEFESLGGMATYNLQLSDRTTWFNEFIFQSTESSGTGSPANFSRAPVDPENPFFPQALIDDIVEEGQVDDFSEFFGFPIFAWGKLPEPRAVEVESDTYLLVSGLETSFDNGWKVEGAFTYGKSESEQVGASGLVISEAFYNANLGNLCSDGSTVERWDVNLVRPSASFVGETCEDRGLTTLWYNPFGGQGQQSAGIDDAIRTLARRDGESEMWSFDIAANGEVFTFNDRAVNGAFGFEYRNEEVKDIPAGVAVASTLNPEPILGFSSTSADAERNIWAAYGELYVPFTDTFDMQFALRYDDFEGFDGDLNPKVAFRWAATDSLIFRGNYSTSFRAPSLAQVGAGTLLSSYRVDCEAVPAACDGDATADGEALLSEDVSNPNLEAEEADTWGLGMLFRPTSNIELNLDYWAIDYENIIGVDEDDFLRRALAGEFPVVGEGELPTGQPGVEVEGGFVIDAHFELTNLGFEDVSGIDLAYTQYFDLANGHEISLLADVTWLLDFERQASPASPVIDEVGEFRYPEFLTNITARWRKDDWRASLRMRYTDSYLDDPSNRTLEAIGLPTDAVVKVDSWTVFDLNVSYDFTDKSFVQFNIRNLFDEEPPLVLGLSANVDHINHNSLGRFATVRYTYAF